MEPKTTESNLGAIIVETVDELAVLAKAESDPAREEGTLIDPSGQIVKLGEEMPEIEIIYGNAVALPDDILTPEE